MHDIHITYYYICIYICIYVVFMYNINLKSLHSSWNWYCNVRTFASNKSEYWVLSIRLYCVNTACLKILAVSPSGLLNCWECMQISLRNAVFWLTRSLHECIFSSWNSGLLVTLHLLLHWFTKFRPLPLSALHVQLAKSVVRPCNWQERRRWKKMSMCDVCGVWVYTLVRFWGIDVLLGISGSFQTKNCWPLDGGSMHLCIFDA